MSWCSTKVQSSPLSSGTRGREMGILNFSWASTHLNFFWTSLTLYSSVFTVENQITFSSNFNRLFGGSFGNTPNQFANSASQFPSIQQPTGFASNLGSTSNRGFDAIRGGGFGGGGSSLPQLPPPSIGGGSTGQQVWLLTSFIYVFFSKKM